MYHHRYQPQTSNLANRNPNAFAPNILHFNNNNKNLSSAISSYQSPAQSQSKPSSLADSSVTPVAVLAATAATVSLDSTANPISSSHSGVSFQSGINHRAINPTTPNQSPFSSLPKQFIEERQDVIFRKVRGILNKITPETFDKLTRELINVGLDSPRTLRGVIYLIFDKALKDLKYSSLYAKLCQELSEKVPNFEREPGPNTFCKFLISKCEDEFERRRKATEDFDSKNELTDEEFEQRTIAKQKMLGNIKFICELGKKRLLQEEILHECIRGLLSKKKKEKPIQDQAQDLECLCQIMRTIGSLLDIEASRNLMNQYFERIDLFSRKPELPSRIRFMLRDVIDLRNNKWRPRPFQREDHVPQPLSKLREELGYGGSSSNASIDKIGNKNLLYINDLSKLSGGKLNSLLLEDEPSFTTTSDFHWGSPYVNNESAYDIFSDTMPQAKIESATISSKSNEASVKSSPTKPSNEFIDLSRLTSSESPTIETFSDYNAANVYNRIDPIFGTIKTRSNANNNINTTINNNNGRRSMPDDGNQLSGFSKRNDFYRNTRGALRGPPHLYESAPHFIRPNEDKPTMNFRFDKGINVGLARGVQTNFQNDARRDFRYSPVRDEPPIGLSNRVPYEDSPRPPPSYRRSEALQTDTRQLPPRLNLNERMPPPTQQSSSFQIRHNNHIDKHVGSIEGPYRNENVAQYPNFNSINDKMNHRERRVIRGGDRVEPRQPKFSAANYKLPGRDRNLVPPVTNREKISNSELSQNWRADSVAPPARTANQNPHQPVNIQTSQQSRSGELALEASSDKKLPDSRVMKVKAENKPSDVKSIIVGDAEPIRKNVQNVAPSVSDRDLGQIRRLNETEVVAINKSVSVAPNKEQGPRRHQDSRRPALHPPSFQTRRSANHDSRDKETASRRQEGPSIEFDGRIFQRAHQNESSSLERKNFKPSIPRNQSFEGSTNSEARKVQIWRKDNPNNNPCTVKDVTANSITNTLLPKPVARASDSDFSLRPSHNLAGRTLSNTNQVHKPALSSIIAENHFQTVENHQNQREQTPKSTHELPPVQESQSKQTKISESETKINPRTQTKSGSVVDQFIEVLSDLSSDQPDIIKITSKVKELKVPKQSQTDCLVGLFKQSIAKSDKVRADACKLLTYLIPSAFDVSALLDAFHVIFEQLQDIEIETPKVKSLVACFMSQTTADGLISIGDVSGMLNGGKHHPMFLLYLQKLDQLNGKVWLSEKYTLSKISLMDMLPEVDRSKDRLAIALKDRCLGFLDPMLTIEPDLWEQMRDRDPAPAAIYRWIKDNIDQSVQSTTTFAHVFVRCLLRYIHNTSMDRIKNFVVDSASNESTDPHSNKSSPTNSVIQALSEHEKELLSKYQHILQAILKDKQMQLASLYALQAFYHSLDFPKGALLRWFHLLYDMSIVDDEVYFIWKEEINDEYPGKGQALFQVNTWLYWLAEAESEDEDEDDG